jgi:hypothetical protein
MNDNNSDSDSDSDSDNDNDDHQLQEEEEEGDFVVDELIPILQRKDEFSMRTRNKINELAREFLSELGNDIHDMICDNNDTFENENYRGLDSDRDTEAEIEISIRFFPDLLSITQTETALYPIQLLAFTCNDDWFMSNLKAVSFIPLVVRLAIEFSLFEDELRGGLLIKDESGYNVLEHLSFTDMVGNDMERYELIDDAYLNVMIQLRHMGLFKKDDILSYDLLMNLCNESVFPRKRFQFLVEWDPTLLLIQTDEDDGCLPLHRAAIMSSTIQAFQTVFDNCIRYYPKKIGISLLFTKNNKGKTPIQIAFRKTKLRDKVMTVIEDTIIRYSSFSENNNTSINIVEALVMAAIDENIHLDCVYFLLRRQPDVLVKLLSSTPAPAGVAVGSNDEDDDDDDDDDEDDGGGDERNDRNIYSNKKRKR